MGGEGPKTCGDEIHFRALCRGLALQNDLLVLSVTYRHAMPAPLGGANPPHDQSEFRPDEGALGLLQQDLRTLIYKLLELSILTQDPQEDGQPESRVALKV